MVAQQLRVLIALEENQHSLPSTHIRPLTSTHNSSFRRSDALFWLQWALPSHMHILTFRQTHTHKLIIILRLMKAKSGVGYVHLKGIWWANCSVADAGSVRKGKEVQMAQGRLCDSGCSQCHWAGHKSGEFLDTVTPLRNNS